MSVRPIRRLLIANRGEITCRIAETAHRLGISTVGIYSEPDRNALHVDAVDLAVALGGASPAESYLRGDAVIQAALDTGCDAIHPGYGFLAENAGFASDVIAAGLIWVGPTPEQITLLGDKVAAKKAAVEAGVPTTAIVEVTPGTVPSGLKMPVLVKAAAGGGGRGMRIVRTEEELGDAIESAAREAASAFGDGTVFIEPFLERGRHVEVQILGDAHGNVIHLYERECSIQRRNQKVVEEAPSPGISDEVRSALHEGALAIARHVGYQNAGTVEFLVGDDGTTINFLEVNTRLQVEHPVTEAITGLDLVEMQLRVAAGEPLPVEQDDLWVDGHAIEVRVVAEDPAAGWLPSTGTLNEFEIGEGVRVDTGFRAGSEVSPEYDSLLAKVIAHDGDRTIAAQQLARALRTASIDGVRTNANTLVAILGEADFLAGDTPTAYLPEHPEVLTAAGPEGEDRLALLLGAVFATEARNRAADRVTGFVPSGWRNLRTRGQRRTWLLDDEEHQVEYVFDSTHDGAAAEVRIGPWPEPLEDGSLPPDERRIAAVRLLSREPGRQVLEIDGRRHVLEVELSEHEPFTARTRSRAGSLTWTQPPRFLDHDAELEGAGPISPLPGVVLSVHVEAGQTVSDGQLLMVVEAMKMEHKITAHTDATVTAVHFAAGDRVDTGDLLVELGSNSEDQ